jgi:acyl carrier protein
MDLHLTVNDCCASEACVGKFMEPEHSGSIATKALPTEADVRDWCIAYLAKSLNLPAELIDPNTKFARFGIDSATSVFLLMELEEWLAIELPTDIVFEHPTIAQLARYIAKYRASEAARGHGR